MKIPKKIIYPVLIVLVIVSCSIGYYFYSTNVLYFKTDNAKITSKMYTITPVTNGKVIEWNVDVGDVVKKDQVLGRQQVLPYITSPINGTIVKNDVVKNETVSAATALAIVADTDNMYVGVNIEETDIRKILVGQDVKITLDAYPDKTFKGKVTEIDNTTQTYFSGTSSLSTSGTYTKVTQLVPVKVSIENNDNLPLTLGMNAIVKIKLK
ncbi:efflux RND transporter periplasmic adaptor subunit [Clostridium butyricum]|uniref:Secretion protein HlyD n=1 Tax=Clostridium butyricum TaxID=1492 RepID=A0A2S7F6Z4_CLOBU|nr:efflux RND transporter periplasmic adaptor subunit [Clostridium butyricum]KHD16301.1 secretion protein HlyD [Clostridium butyricum]MBS5981740.1 efflux RND transporter periplasmic adaptor subunit [Clostridium butyricum]MBZ0311291.1 efflux RND transporter periplasmic adaptor subunit [Clostridium butyricum]MDU4749695.1 efflux RND transporter periplasmic adaptor subunit [Clostridium butyricum]PPV12610.1 secretion protein HlyD [Clostridium butyricum]